MCNLSYNILEKGKIEILVSLVKKHLLSITDAAAELGITEEKFKTYL